MATSIDYRHAKVLVLTRYPAHVATSRLRFHAFRRVFGGFGKVHYSPFFDTDGVTGELGRMKRIVATLTALARRLRILSHFRRGPGPRLLIVEQEVVPRAPWPIEWTAIWFSKSDYLIFDHDDAFYVPRRRQSDPAPADGFPLRPSRKFRSAWLRADAIVAGSKTILTDVRSATPPRTQTALIPTCTDVAAYASRATHTEVFSTDRLQPDVVKLGWIGSASTAHLLEGFAEVFRKAGALTQQRLEIVAIGPTNWSADLGLPATFLAWSEHTEKQLALLFDIGIMPLHDTAFQSRKCGFKIVQYMAAGLPTIASHVGINRALLGSGIDRAGLLARDEADWVQSIVELADHRQLRDEMGKAARSTAMREYSLETAAQAWSKLLHSLLREAH